MYKIKKQKKAFTLVELIVVIAILAILGTISFISLQSYNMDARDGKRVADITNIKKSLDIYSVKEWKYPDPTGAKEITYSWAKIWDQWTFWDSVLRETKNVSNIPLDPVTNTEYSYSLLNSKKEYELWSILEWEWKLAGLYWNYNWLVAKVFTWSTTWPTNYVLALPSITNSDMSETDIVDILNWDDLVVEWEVNTPASYSWTTLYVEGQIPTDLIEESELIVYQWDLWDLDTPEERQTFLSDLQAFYPWAPVDDNTVVWNMLWLEADEASDYVKNVVNNYLWGNISIIDVIENLFLTKSVWWIGNDYWYSIAVDNSGYIYVAWYFKDESVDFFGENKIPLWGTESFIVKLDNNLNKVWVKTSMSTDVDKIKDITLGSDGNIYITWDSQWSAPLFGKSFPSPTIDVFVAKIDSSNWEAIWVEASWWSWDEYASDIKVDDSWNVYVTWDFDQTGNLFGVPKTNLWFSDIFVAKLNSSDWTTSWVEATWWTEFDTATSFAISDNWNIYVAWRFSSSFSIFGESETNQWLSDIFVARLNPSDWTSIWVSTAWWSWQDYGESIVADSSWHVYVTWYFSWTNTNLFGETKSSSWTNDIFIAKLHENDWNQLWVKESWLIDDYDQWKFITLDDLWNLYIAWEFRSWWILFWESISNAWYEDIFLAKMSSIDWSLIELETTWWPGQEFLTSIAVNNNWVYTIWFFEWSISNIFWEILDWSWGYDVFISKLNSNLGQ